MVVTYFNIFHLEVELEKNMNIFWTLPKKRIMTGEVLASWTSNKI